MLTYFDQFASLKFTQKILASFIASAQPLSNLRPTVTWINMNENECHNSKFHNIIRGGGV